MTWAEAVAWALRHYARTGKRCEVFRSMGGGWVAIFTNRRRYSPRCGCRGCVSVRLTRNGEFVP